MDNTTQKPITNSLIPYLICFIIGSGLGSFSPFFFSFYQFFFITLGTLGLALLFPSRLIQLILTCFVITGLGFYWTHSHFQRLALAEPMTYNGTVELLSASAPLPQQRIVLQLEEGERRGQKIRAFVYDWTYATGTKLHVNMSVTPSQFTSDRGSGIIGLSRDVTVNKVTQTPNPLWQSRHFISDRVALTLAEPYASLAVGLLTGTSDNFDLQFKEQLQISGTSHLVAVSGYNMTLVALMISRIANRFGQKMSFFLSLGVILFYYLLTGMSPAVARGAIFTFFLLWAKFLGRPIQTIRILLLTAVVMIFFWPLGMIYSLSWQLSFLAFIGILFLEPMISRWVSFLEPFRFVLIKKSLTETIAAQIPVLPLTLLTFGTISLISPLTNIAVLTLVPYAMVLSALLALGAMIAVPLGFIVAWLIYPLLWIITSIIQISSQIPFASVSLTPVLTTWFIIVYSLFVFAGILIWFKSKKHEPS